MAELTDFVRTRHRVSGKIDEATPRHIAEHEVLGEHLEIVGPDAKPYLPEMHRVTLPADATPDQKRAAENAGFDLDEVLIPASAAETKSVIASERAKANVVEDPKKIGKD